MSPDGVPRIHEAIGGQADQYFYVQACALMLGEIGREPLNAIQHPLRRKLAAAQLFSRGVGKLLTTSTQPPRREMGEGGYISF